jgi:large subunit ribosomal protein L4
MPTVDIVTQQNGKAGKVELSPVVFGATPKPHLFHAEVRRQLAKRRAGTHSSKNRAAVSGGGIKPWRQKGTGRARQGTNRAPQWAGGGVVFGPVPRDHAHSLPKKVRRAALRGALSLRVNEEALRIVDALSLDAYSTKRMVALLGALGYGPEKAVLVVLDEANDQIERSARNLPWVSVLRVEGLNVYDVLRHSSVLMTRAALAIVEARLGDGDAEETA